MANSFKASTVGPWVPMEPPGRRVSLVSIEDTEKAEDVVSPAPATAVASAAAVPASESADSSVASPFWVVAVAGLVVEGTCIVYRNQLVRGGGGGGGVVVVAVVASSALAGVASAPPKVGTKGFAPKFGTKALAFTSNGILVLWFWFWFCFTFSFFFFLKFFLALLGETFR